MMIDWNDVDLCIRIIVGVWSILNIGVTIWGYLNRKNKKSFLDEVKQQYEKERKEHSRMCTTCRKNYDKHIETLVNENTKLLNVISSTK